jgi:hypothetical protein
MGKEKNAIMERLTKMHDEGAIFISLQLEKGVSQYYDSDLNMTMYEQDGSFQITITGQYKQQQPQQ